eukprot:scaffold42969_cov22-Tisochrysis_lutea.AAC.4
MEQSPMKPAHSSLSPDVQWACTRMVQVPINPYNPASYKKSKPKPPLGAKADGQAGGSCRGAATGTPGLSGKEDGVDHSKDADQSTKPVARPQSKQGGGSGGSSEQQGGEGHAAREGPYRGDDDVGDCGDDVDGCGA